MREELLQERKKAIYGLICDELYVPMKAKEIAAVLNVPKSDRRDLAEVLDALVAEGKVEVSSKGKYMKSEGKFLTGVFAAHPRGFGFVTVEGEDEDIFIPESQVNGAFHGDTVQVALTRAEGHGRRREGQITKILIRGVSRIVCTYEKSKTFGFAVPDNPRFGQDIFIPQERSKGAVSGHKVVVELTDFGGNGKKPEGKVVEILGHVNDPGTDILSIVRGYDLPTEFPEKIMNQVERVAGEVSTADMAGRMDLRDWQTVTIDGEDAKDLDDAITLTKEGDVYRLGVHIEDGVISVDGYDLTKISIESLRRQMGVMTQDNFIFHGTVRENILYGKLDATDEEMIAAAKAVNAHEFIMKMEKGYDTELKEHGAGLSIGQRQLIAFARTMISMPKILILDEATSSIDTHTEILVQKGIEALLSGRTSFVIAHRLSTIQNADRIFVIDQGGILEQGSPAELMKKKGAYYDLYMAQFAGLE